MRRGNPALAVLLLAGCGYQLGEPSIAGVSTVSIPMVKNLTLRRGNEFGAGGHEIDLTQAIRDRVLSETGYGLASVDTADLVAKVDLNEYSTPFLVEDKADRPLVSNVTVRVKLVVQRRDGTVVYEGTREETGHLVPSRDEDEAAARAEAFAAVARWVVGKLQGGW
ncbi:MAG: hypothetical protein HUU15_01305 [Candidatus Brocadiae bacterium]|nr:hypothetical protein [Candidatus Brocadiia bacterium]